MAGPPGAAARPRDPASGPVPGGSRRQGMVGGPSGLETGPLVPVLTLPRPRNGGAAARWLVRLGRGDKISSPHEGPRPAGPPPSRSNQPPEAGRRPGGVAPSGLGSAPPRWPARLASAPGPPPEAGSGGPGAEASSPARETRPPGVPAEAAGDGFSAAGNPCPARVNRLPGLVRGSAGRAGGRPRWSAGLAGAAAQSPAGCRRGGSGGAGGLGGAGGQPTGGPGRRGRKAAGGGHSSRAVSWRYASRSEAAAGGVRPAPEPAGWRPGWAGGVAGQPGTVAVTGLPGREAPAEPAKAGSVLARPGAGQ